MSKVTTSTVLATKREKLLTIFQEDEDPKNPKVNWESAWREEAAKRRREGLQVVADDVKQAPVLESSKGEEPQKMNDAIILGTAGPNMGDDLQRPCVFMVGELYGQKDRRNTRPGKWKRVEYPIIHWITGDEETGMKGLTHHPVNEEKGGASIVPSENFDGERTDQAVKTMHAIGIDIDTGNQLEAVKQRLLDEGIFAVIYTTHSHGKTSMEIKSDVVQKKLRISDTPNLTQVHEYLRTHAQLDPEFVKQVEIVNAKKHTKDGLLIELKTRRSISSVRSFHSRKRLNCLTLHHRCKAGKRRGQTKSPASVSTRFKRILMYPPPTSTACSTRRATPKAHRLNPM